MYWALYDQQGSRWTIQVEYFPIFLFKYLDDGLQAMRMNGYTFGHQILPDQMQVANPILILTLIPLFDYVLYPALGWYKSSKYFHLSHHPREGRYPEDPAAENCHRVFPVWPRLCGFRHPGAGAEERLPRASQ